MKMHTYVNFGGQCAQAFRFYEKQLAGRVSRSTESALRLKMRYPHCRRRLADPNPDVRRFAQRAVENIQTP